MSATKTNNVATLTLIIDDASLRVVGDGVPPDGSPLVPPLPSFAVVVTPFGGAGVCAAVVGVIVVVVGHTTVHERNSPALLALF